MRKSPLVWADLLQWQKVFLRQNREHVHGEGAKHSDDDEVPSEVVKDSDDDLGYLSDEMRRNPNGTPLPTRVL